jgi:regulator of sirC expression with transglutaminase-like and TPR domain
MKIITTICLVFFITEITFSQSSYTGQAVEDIFELPEEEINIGVASLVLAKEFYPNMNVDFFLYAFDYMAQRFNSVFGHIKDPDERVRALNTYFYRPGYWNDGITFSYDDDDLNVRKLSNRFINGYIATKKGSCITMPLLYVIIGERLGWPIYPVRSAKHFFVRYIPNEPTFNFQQNIEATNGGSYISNNQYQLDVGLPDKAIKNGVYLRTLSKKEYLASLLLVNANQHLENNNIEKAKKYLRIAMKYDSTLSSAYWNYALIHLAEARRLEEELYYEQQTEISYYQVQAMNKKNRQEINPNRFKPKQKNIMDFLKIKEPQKANFGSFGQNIPSKNNEKEFSQNRNISLTSNQRAELQFLLISIEEKYKPKILAKLDVYRKYKNKAEELGIVTQYPLEFFIKQSERLKKFKEGSSGFWEHDLKKI